MPCPVCGVSPKGKNFVKHQDKHPGAVVATTWRSARRTLRYPFGVTLRVEPDAVWLGRKHVAPQQVRMGSAWRSRPDGLSSTGGVDPGYGTVEEHAGTYLAIGKIVVRCDISTDVRRNWTGWEQGGRRKRWRVTLHAGDFVAFQYALAELGLLQPR